MAVGNVRESTVVVVAVVAAVAAVVVEVVVGNGVATRARGCARVANGAAGAR